jgi:hypothetical protein
MWSDSAVKSKIVLPVLGVALVLLGVLAFILQPGPPDPVCAEPGAPTSGFTAEGNPDCAITIESYNEIRDYETSPKPFRIAGLLLVLGGVGVGVVGLILLLVRRSKGKEATNSPPGG